jgi:hypothetical protein
LTNDDLLFRLRVHLFARAGQVGVGRACRELGYHRSSYYRPRRIAFQLAQPMWEFDCFHICRLSGTRGRVWQYTAIDVASSFTWAELHVTPLNSAAPFTSALVRRVAAETRRCRLEAAGGLR